MNELTDIKVTGWTNWDNPNYINLDTILLSPFFKISLQTTIAQELRNKGYKFTGSYHQESECYEENYGGVPIINHKYIAQFSCREWGSIMIKAYPEYSINELVQYDYCIWAWIPPENEEQIFPKAQDYKY